MKTLLETLDPLIYEPSSNFLLLNEKLTDFKILDPQFLGISFQSIDCRTSSIILVSWFFHLGTTMY